MLHERDKVMKKKTRITRLIELQDYYLYFKQNKLMPDTFRREKHYSQSLFNYMYLVIISLVFAYAITKNAKLLKQ